MSSKQVYLYIAIIIAFLGVTFAPLAKFSYDFENFFPKNSPLTEQFNKHRDNFGSDNDFVLLAFPVGNPSEIKKGYDLFEKLSALELVDSVAAIYNYKIIQKDPFSNVPITFNLANDSLIRWSFFKLQNFDFDYLFSADSTYTLMRVIHQPYISKDKSEQLYNELVLLKEQYPQMRTAGRIVGQMHYLEVMKTEMLFFVAISLILIVLFIWFIYRSWKLIIACLLIVLVSIISCVGAIKIGGDDLNLLLSITPSIIFIVAISDVVHYLSTLQLVDPKKEIDEKLSWAFSQVGLATGLTSVTTAVGFFSLAISNIQPLRVFGIYTGIGVLLAYLFTFTLMPIMVKKWKAFPSLRVEKTERFQGQLNKVFQVLMQHQWKVVGSFIIIVIASFFALKEVKINNYLLEDLSIQDPVRKDFSFMDEKMGGSRPIEIAIHMDTVDLNHLQKFEDLAIECFGLNHPFSLVKVLKRVHYFKYGTYQLPDDNQRLRKLYLWSKKKGFLNQVENKDYYRVSGLLRDNGGLDYLEKEELFKERVNKELGMNSEGYYVTGAASLIDHNNKLLSGSMIKGLLLAFFIVGLIMAGLFKSIKMIFIALLVNIVPLLLVLISMVLMEVDIKISTSIIFSIIFGIAVDDTIHFLMKYRREMNQGFEGLKKTYVSSGRLLIITTFIISSGFIMLLASNFTATYYVGVFVSLGLVYALISDLILLPVLIRLLFKHRL